MSRRRPTTCCRRKRRAPARPGKPWSFLHISKPEIDLPPGTDPYAPQVYAKAAENLKRMLDQGVLVRDDAPCYYAYRLVMGAHVADRAGRRCIGRGIRPQPHPQARVHAARQGRRPGAPDRGAQRPDRAGAAGVSRSAGCGRDAGGSGPPATADRRRHGGHRRAPHALGDRRSGRNRGNSCAASMRCRRSTSPTGIIVRLRLRALPRRGEAESGRGPINS